MKYKHDLLLLASKKCCKKFVSLGKSLILGMKMSDDFFSKIEHEICACNFFFFLPTSYCISGMLISLDNDLYILLDLTNFMSKVAPLLS